MEPKRLNKFISDSGMCSRREADKLLEQGRVTVNGKLPKPGTMVTPKDKVRIDDQLLTVREEEPVFLAFNKPAGIAVTTELSVRNNIIHSLNYPASIQPIGHMDRDEEGLIFLSNDTEIVRKLSRADNRFEKEYIVNVDKPLTSEFLSKLSKGEEAPEPGSEQKSAKVTKEATTRFRIVLEPGTNHHLKKRCESLGYKVQHLQRVRIGGIKLTKLPVGYWRALSEEEVALITAVLSVKVPKPANTFRKFDTGKAKSAERTPGSSTTARPRNAGSGSKAASKETTRGPKGAAKNDSRNKGGTTTGPKGRTAPSKGTPRRGGR